MTKTILILMMMTLTLSLSGCGKRARYLDPPDGTHEIYPKHYPPADEPGSHL